MIRRVLALTGVLLLALPGSALAVSLAGPRLAFIKWGPRPYAVSLMTTDPSGLNQQPLVRAFRRTRPAPFPFETPSWSPDGGSIAFTGYTGRLYDEGSQIFTLPAEGGPLQPIIGTEAGFAPVFSRDGASIAFSRMRERTRIERSPGEYREFVERAVSIWLVDLSSGIPRQLTPWRFGVESVPSSFTPDGRAVVATRVANKAPPRVVAIRLDGSGSTLLARNASSGEFSPDGSWIAYFWQGRRYREEDDDGGVTTARTTDLIVRATDGSRSIRLTDTPKLIETGLTWDPSGQRLAFVQVGKASSFFETGGTGNAIVQINADGTCRKRVLSLPKAALFGVVWQPGPGREAGRIRC